MDRLAGRIERKEEMFFFGLCVCVWCALSETGQKGDENGQHKKQTDGLATSTAIGNEIVLKNKRERVL